MTPPKQITPAPATPLPPSCAICFRWHDFKDDPCGCKCHRRAAPPAPPTATVAPALEPNFKGLKRSPCNCATEDEVHEPYCAWLNTFDSAAPSLPLAELERLEALNAGCKADPPHHRREINCEFAQELINAFPSLAATIRAMQAEVEDAKEETRIHKAAGLAADRLRGIAVVDLAAQAERVRELEAAQMTQRCIAIADIADEKIHRAAKTVEAFMDEVRGRDSALVRLNEGVIYDAIDYIYNYAIVRDERNELGKKMRAQAERVRVLEKAKDECLAFTQALCHYGSPGQITSALQFRHRIQSLVGAGEKEQGK